jgi:RNA polymerase sigma-70 factor (ECF subfamily)
MAEPAHQVLTELLVLRAQAGHGDAICLLVRVWQERLLRHARRLTEWHDDAEDILQDSWMDIASGLHGLDDPARFGAWAYRIVTRRCALRIRRQQRRREVERKFAAMHVPAPEREAATDAIDAVRVALRQLPAEQKAILELRYVDDFGIKQIAEILGIAAGTVKSRLFSAREHLRKILAKVTQ